MTFHDERVLYSLSLSTLKTLNSCFKENTKIKTHFVKVTRLGSGERAQASLSLHTSSWADSVYGRAGIGMRCQL